MALRDELEAGLNAEILDAVEEAVHPRHGGDHDVPLLTAKLHIPQFAHSRLMTESRG